MHRESSQHWLVSPIVASIHLGENRRSHHATCWLSFEANMGSPDFDKIVSDYYEPLYRFAFSLAGIEAEAQDLTQQTLYIWATKGHQLRDRSKVKTWLFTTLHRAFLEGRRRRVRFPHFELSDSEVELPPITAETVHEMDCSEVVKALRQLDEIYQGAVAL